MAYMPELPEVETIKLGLQQKIIGLEIAAVEILNAKTFQGDEQVVIGGKVVKVWRAAKLLGIDVARVKDEGGRIKSLYTLLFHLKMSGQVIYEGIKGMDKGGRFVGGHPTLDMREEMPNRSTRVVIIFSDRSRIYFNDQRKFGWIKVFKTGELKIKDLLAGYGPEPLDKSFTVEVMKENLLKHKNWPVKVAIMDQATIAGIGNIYAAEACFDAKLDPRVRVGELEEKDFVELHKGIIRSLNDGVKYGGSSRAHFVNAEGEKGLFLDYAYVYGRKGEPCKKCGTLIDKITLGGRGTYFCPNCQKLGKIDK